jgi:hypothetical protein
MKSKPFFAVAVKPWPEKTAGSPPQKWARDKVYWKKRPTIVARLNNPPSWRKI